MNLDSIIDRTLKAKSELRNFKADARSKALEELISALEQSKTYILERNIADLQNAKDKLSDANIDRMTLTEERFNDMIVSVKKIVELPDIVGEIFDSSIQSSGIATSKMRIPIGAILMIYESRPNVTVDAAALAIKTGNTIILKGGREVEQTNKALGEAIGRALNSAGLPEGAVTVLSDNSRELVSQLLERDKQIDLVIPRGSQKLLEFVQKNSKIPTLQHLEGNCHVYIDKSADPAMAKEVVIDAKTQRYGTCNTAESLLIHQGIVDKVLPDLSQALLDKNVEIRGDKVVCQKVKAAKPAKESDWSEEYLGPVISIKVVNSLEAAIDHINTYGSGHTDTIVTNDAEAADRFLKTVDSSSVMHNTSTRLADGFEYGLGAEIGTATGKLHARGPVGQEGLLTYKWIVKSDGVTKGGIVREQK